jgi:WD40 repeat protein
VLALGSTNGTITIWDVAQRVERAKIKAHSPSVRALAFSPDSRRLASCGKDRMVKVWDVNTGESAEPAWYINTPWDTTPGAIAFSHDGKLLAANNYGAIEIYDFATHQVCQHLPGHSAGIRCVAFLPDGKTLVSGGNNWTLKFWDLTTGQERRELEQLAGEPDKLVVSPDGTRLAIAQADGTVEVREIESRQARLYGHRDLVCALAFSPDGTRLASGSADKAIKIWDLACPVDLPPGARQGHKVWALAYSPDGKLLASGADPGTGPLSVLEVATGQVRATLPYAIAAAFSPDGKVLAGNMRNEVALWDVATWQQQATLSGGHPEFVTAVKFSPDGKTLASASQDGTICLWEIAGRRRRANLDDAHPSGWVFSLEFSPDGASLASAGHQDCVRGEAALWDVATGRKRATLPRGTIWVTFSPDGKTLASGLLGGSIGLWDAATGRLKAELSGHAKLARTMAFLPDGRTLASCNSEGSITFWDTVRGQQRATVRRVQNEALAIAVSPNGRTLAVGGIDGQIQFWQAADEREVTEPRLDFAR